MQIVVKKYLNKNVWGHVSELLKSENAFKPFILKRLNDSKILAHLIQLSVVELRVIYECLAVRCSF